MTTCPYCNYKATNHEELEDKGFNPSLEDVSFCISCGEVSLFTKEGLVKVDVKTLPRENQEEIREIEIAWLRTKRSRDIDKDGDQTNG